MSANAVTPDSANKCGELVCIDVVGSGLHVTDWDTGLYGNFGCSTPSWTAGYKVVRSGPRICPDTDEDGEYVGYWSPNKNYANDTVLFNNWTVPDDAESPTVKVHS